MAQNAKLMAALSKGGGGGDGGGGGSNNSGRHKTPWKEKKLCPNCKKVVVHNPTSVSPSKRTRTNAPRDGAPNVGNDRDRGPRIMTQY